MAKISELVKTYRLLSDPNAPDWNVKFIGGIVVALALVAAAGFLVYRTNADEPGLAAPAAVEQPAAGAPEAQCSAAEAQAEMDKLGVTSVPDGYKLPSGCVVASA